ncbi:uncharacterized protein LOC122820187 [Gambusia affinis]|uniref:uncharacterized protein LOC122820187 n=1 Tax=Gambusia affinis TaxID=33528 RepID=UPI001CDD4752|nr:uncharacterized protein LOC122820187 [Gambusia affinis]XP_043953338.1 uncharacterized protein LOC122820187 [Gambusia affinis]
MAEAGQRLEALSCNKSLLRIVSLLFLVHIGQSLDFQSEQHKIMNGIQKTKEGVRLLMESESGTEFILTLLEKANSVAKKRQLKLFQQYLQEAVDEAYRQKVEKKAETTVYAQQFHMMIPGYFAKRQQMQTSSNPLMDSLDQIVEICRSYFELRKNLFTGEAKETETKLEYTLKNLKSRQNIHSLVGVMIILLLLLLCIVGAYKVCYRVFTWII